MGTLSLKSTGQGQDKLAEFFDTFCPGRRQEKLAERWYSWQAVAPHQLLRVGGVEIALQHFVDDDGGLVFRNDLRVELAVVSQKNCFLERITEELLPRNPERVGEQHDGGGRGFRIFQGEDALQSPCGWIIQIRLRAQPGQRRFGIEGKIIFFHRIGAEHPGHVAAGVGHVRPGEILQLQRRQLRALLSPDFDEFLRAAKTAEPIPMRVVLPIQRRDFLRVNKRPPQIQNLHCGVSLHVFQKLIELGFAVGRNGGDKPSWKFFGIDALLVGRDYEKIFDAALRQPVAPFFQQRLPQLQLPRRELRQAEKMFDHLGLAPKEPVILSDDDFVNTAVVKEAELPVLKQADEFFAEAEMVVEVGFEAGDEFLGGGEAGLLQLRKRRGQTVFTRRTRVVEIETFIQRRQPQQAEENDNDQHVRPYAGWFR